MVSFARPIATLWALVWPEARIRLSCREARASRPMVMITTATSTSMRLKPRADLDGMRFMPCSSETLRRVEPAAGQAREGGVRLQLAARLATAGFDVNDVQR